VTATARSLLLIGHRVHSSSRVPFFDALNWALNRVGTPLTAISGVLLHVYTVVTAFNLAENTLWRWAVVVPAWGAPVAAELVVAYYAWRATGTIVNGYSVWLLAWIALVVGVLLLAQLARRRLSPPHRTRDTRFP
jgi:hypothetical protein